MVRAITWQRKAVIMQRVLGLSEIHLSDVDPAVLVWVEMVYLALACTTPHDYLAGTTSMSHLQILCGRPQQKALCHMQIASWSTRTK
jgi:hypothetical protein